LWSKANQVRIENCHFSYCDWSCSGKGGTVQGDGWRNVYRRLEFEWCPRSETLAPGPTSLVELCDFGQKLGHGEEDGANVQLARHFGSTVRYCWFHSNRKFGPRFDGPVQTPERIDGRIHHNVCFDMNTLSPFRREKQGPEVIKVKGDAHWVVNNTLLNIAGVGIGVPGEWRSFGPERKLLANFNGSTITRNNISRLISSDRIVARAEAGETRLPASWITTFTKMRRAIYAIRLTGIFGPALIRLSLGPGSLSKA
jgi:hypothetical protein